MCWCSYWSVYCTLPCCSRCISFASPPEFSGSPILVSQSLCVYSHSPATFYNVAQCFLKKTDLLPHKVTKSGTQQSIIYRLFQMYEKLFNKKVLTFPNVFQTNLLSNKIGNKGKYLGRILHRLYYTLILEYPG